MCTNIHPRSPVPHWHPAGIEGKRSAGQWNHYLSDLRPHPNQALASATRGLPSMTQPTTIKLATAALLGAAGFAECSVAVFVTRPLSVQEIGGHLLYFCTRWTLGQ